jgi:guanosine-3',5'-bis(diphosphate) 3'-pyrophosphohydrolase
MLLKRITRMTPGAGTTTLLLRALDFAADRHRDQRRKDQRGSPYVNHLITVARLLAETGGITDPAVLVAAVLHDTVEDVGVSPAEIEEKFGTEVRGIVAEVTDDKSLEKDERKRLQVEHAPHMSAGAKLVKIADKIANLHDVIERPPVGWTRHRRESYMRWSAAVVNGCRGASPELEKLFDSLLAQGFALLGGQPASISPSTARP